MRKGFTLVETVIVVAIIALLASIVVVAASSARVRERNAQRSTDAATILNALYQYALDNNGTLPSTITSATTSICRTGSLSCTGLIDLSALTSSQKYLISLPNDPQGTSTTSTGYTIVQNATTKRVTISAPSAEGGATISVTR